MSRTNQVNRYFGVAALALFSVLVVTAIAQAAPLGVGATLFPVPGEPDPTGACAGLRPAYGSGSSGTFSGTLFSVVLFGDPSNPYPGGLTFVYQLPQQRSQRECERPIDGQRLDGIPNRC